MSSLSLTHLDKDDGHDAESQEERHPFVVQLSNFFMEGKLILQKCDNIQYE